MIDVESIRKAALYYINNDVTLEDAALYVGIKSKKTLNNYFARLCGSKDEKDRLLYKKIVLKKYENEQKGKAKGGQTGVRKSSYTRDEAFKIYDYIIKNSATYRQTAEEFQIPRSTIYEIVHSNLLTDDEKKKIELVSESNVPSSIDNGHIK